MQVVFPGISVRVFCVVRQKPSVGMVVCIFGSTLLMCVEVMVMSSA